MKRIVLATLGSLGDVYPVLALGAGLRARGHSVAVATMNGYRPRVEALGLEFRPLGPHFDPEDAAVARLAADVRNGSEYIFRRLLMPYLEAIWEETLKAIEGADFVVSHPITLGIPMAAEKSPFPWASMALSPLSLMSKNDSWEFPGHPVVSAIYRAVPWLRGAIWAGGRARTRRWIRPLLEFRRKLGLPTDRHPLFEGQHSPRLVLALFSGVLTSGPQPDWPANTAVTGFCFHGGGELPPELDRFLSAGPPPLVFTLGSTAVHDAGDFYAESVAAARALGKRAVLLGGKADGPDVCSVPYAPHFLLFPRAEAIVCTGGIGTVGQALRSGKPFLVVPYGNDQPDNAFRCARLGAARVLPRPKYRRDRATDALRRITSLAPAAEEAGRRVRGEDGVRTACEAIERVFR